MAPRAYSVPTPVSPSVPILVNVSEEARCGATIARPDRKASVRADLDVALAVEILLPPNLKQTASLFGLAEAFSLSPQRAYRACRRDNGHREEQKEEQRAHWQCLCWMDGNGGVHICCRIELIRTLRQTSV